jgi:phospholipid/cholesterol/gamma-HCH transport system permease protein
MSAVEAKSPSWRLERHDDTAVLALSGDWIASETGVRSATQVQQILQDARLGALRIDAAHVGRWDSALIAFLKMICSQTSEHRGQPIQIDLKGLPETVRRLVDLAAAATASRAPGSSSPSPHNPIAVRVGEVALGLWAKTVDIAGLVGDVILRIAASLTGRAYTRISDVWQLIREAGPRAFAIVAIVNGLVGAILAFVGSVQLQRFGAGIYVANLVGVAVVREMAAIVTAIVMSGRTGGAYAAHIATMQGNEEIDALNVLGIPVFDFVVLPRVLALVTMMPLLYLYACAIALVGGMAVSVAVLDLTPVSFLQQLREAVSGAQFGIGLVKSVAFGILVALASCYVGLNAGRSAADVGRAATTAAVSGIVGVIALDAVFAVCANALGI